MQAAAVQALLRGDNRAPRKIAVIVPLGYKGVWMLLGFDNGANGFFRSFRPLREP